MLHSLQERARQRSEQAAYVAAARSAEIPPERASDLIPESGAHVRLANLLEWRHRLLHGGSATHVAVHAIQILVQEVLRSLDVLLPKVLDLLTRTEKPLLQAEIRARKVRSTRKGVFLLLDASIECSAIELGGEIVERIRLHWSRADDIPTRTRKFALQAILDGVGALIEHLPEIGIGRGTTGENAVYVVLSAPQGVAVRITLYVRQRLVLKRGEAGDQLLRGIYPLKLRQSLFQPVILIWLLPVRSLVLDRLRRL